MVALINTPMRLSPAASTLKTGVYAIRNQVNGKVYVGSSVSPLRKRWRHHKRWLKRGLHKNHRLQADWNSFGEQTFSFSVLAVCSPEWCRCLELFHMRHLNSIDPDFGYNIDAHVVPYSPDSYKFHGVKKPKTKKGSFEFRESVSRGARNFYRKNPSAVKALVERLKKCSVRKPGIGFENESVKSKALATMAIRRKMSSREGLIASIATRKKDE